MFDLTLTDEQLEFRDTLRDFVSRELKPAAVNATRLQRLRPPFPLDLLQRAAPLGLHMLMLGEDAGGAAADTLTAAMVVEELAAGDVDVAMAAAHTALLAPLLFDAAMNAEQRAHHLPRYAADTGCHLAWAGAAPEGPGWLYHRQRAAASAVLPEAVPAGGGWVLNGEAGFVMNAPIAGLLAVEAMEAKTGERVLLLVVRDTPGLTVRDLSAGSSTVVKWYHGAGGAVSFAGCRVPSSHRLQWPDGCKTLLKRGVALRAAVNLGLGRAAFEAAVDYAKLRVQGGRPIIQHQAIGAKLADIAVHLEAARNMVWKAAWVLDHPDAAARQGDSALPLETAARVFTAESVRSITENAAECFGAMGVMLDMPLQKYVHDAVIFLHSGVSDTVEKFEVAEAVAGFASAA